MSLPAPGREELSYLIVISPILSLIANPIVDVPLICGNKRECLEVLEMDVGATLSPTGGSPAQSNIMLFLMLASDPSSSPISANYFFLSQL